MIYYLAISWNRESKEEALLADEKIKKTLDSKNQNWSVYFEDKGLTVLCATEAPRTIHKIYKLNNNLGIIIGRLFYRSYINEKSHEQMPKDVELDEEESRKIISSSGRSLIDEFWGGYIAFLRNPDSGETWVLRDPSGEIPCQKSRIGPLNIYFIRLRDYSEIGEEKLTVNEHFLAGYIMFVSTARRETGLQQVETLLPGECDHLANGKSNKYFYWNPIEISQRSPINDHEEASRIARYTLRSSVHAWASCHDGIVHSLSGGLDSSIVLSCLKSAPNNPTILCRHYFMEDAPNSDERRYARLAAQKNGAELREIAVTEDLNPDFDYSKIFSPFPSGWPLDVDEHLEEDDQLSTEGYSTEFYGHGGDELFCRLTTLPPATDYAWSRGFGRHLLPFIATDCNHRSISLWRASRAVHFYGIAKKPWHMRLAYHPAMQEEKFSIMTTEARQETYRDTSHWHPLYQSRATIPPVKHEHTFVLVNGLSAAYAGIPVVHPLPARSPLKSQPLLEACIRMPVYLNFHENLDRSIARKAFSGDLPDEIALRRSKAFGTHRIKNILDGKMNEVRDKILGGIIIEKKFIDRKSIESALSKTPTSSKAETLNLCDLMSLELWARKFNT